MVFAISYEQTLPDRWTVSNSSRRNIQINRKQNISCRLNFHPILSHMITCTHLRTKLRLPILNIPLQSLRRNNRRLLQRNNSNVFPKSRTWERLLDFDSVLPSFQHKGNRFAGKQKYSPRGIARI